MFIMNAPSTTILFDAGATHSFINPATTKQIDCNPEEMDDCV